LTGPGEAWSLAQTNASVRHEAVIKEAEMAYRIVVPHDYGPEADHALEWAAELIRAAGGTLVLLHVILVPGPPLRKMPMIPALRPTEDPDESVGKLRTTAERHGVPAEVDVFETSDAGPGIVARAKELGADLIAMGSPSSHHGGFYRAIMGSVVDQVVWHAVCPVVVVRPRGTGEGSALTITPAP
jgi:nucleotide-binding universal stress UspA family protein